MKQRQALLIGNFVGGFVGGVLHGILNSETITISLLSGLVFGFCVALSTVSMYVVKNKILKALTFSLILGISVACLSFFLFPQNKEFIQYSIPILSGFIVGGSIFSSYLVFRYKEI